MKQSVLLKKAFGVLAGFEESRKKKKNEEE